MPPDPALPPEQPSRHEKILVVVWAYALFAGLWILLSDKLVEILFTNPEQIILASMFKGWLFVGVTSLLLYGLMRRSMGSKSSHTKPASSLRLGLSFGLLATVIITMTGIGIGTIFVQHKETQLARLQAIANLKTQQISDWLKERHDDGEFVQTSDYFAGQYHRWQVLGDLQSGGNLEKSLEQFRQSRGYSAISLLNPQGERLWGSGKSPLKFALPLQGGIKTAIEKRQIHFVGPYRGVRDYLRLDIVVPITLLAPPVPLVVLHINLADWLLPTLQSWPVPSASGEILLFRRDGDQILFLNELRFQKDTAAKLHLPIATEDLLPAQVLRGEVVYDNPVEGTDYRGIPAIGIVHAIAGTDWLLIAKLNQSEIYGEAAWHGAWIGFVGLLLLFIANSGLYLFRQHQQLKYANTVQQAQAERLRALKLLAAIADSSGDAIYAKDLDGRYVLFNSAASRIVGKPAEKVLGHDDRNIFPAGQAQRLMETGKQIIASKQTKTYEEVLDTVDGERIFLATKGPLYDGQGNITGLFGISHDITERKRAEAALLASESGYRSLFENMMNGYAHCLMLYQNDEPQDFVYLKVNKAFATLTGLKDVVGRKASEVIPGIRKTDPDLLAIYGNVARGGPPQQFECYIKALQMWFSISVYRSNPQQFVAIFDVITERKLAEEALKELSDDLAATLQAVPDLLFEIDESGRYIKVKATQEELLAVPPSTLLGRTVQETLPPEAAQTIMESVRVAGLTGADYGRTITLPLANGERSFELSVARKSGIPGHPQHFVALSRDITDRKAAEEALRLQAEELAERNAELQRFNRAMVGREQIMIELKQEVNDLCHQLGRKPPYDLVFLDDNAPQTQTEKPG